MNPLAHRFEAGRLMVIVSDRLSALATKGEITPRYYNPGEMFREIHLVLTNDDQPDPHIVKKMVGEADLYIHNLPTRRLFLKSAGWRPFLLRNWAAKAVELARDIQPDLIRCHGAHLNSFAAREIKRALAVPYVISMHTNPDLDMRFHPKREGNLLFRLMQWASIDIENLSLRDADCVVCVYHFIESYARDHGARRVEVIYNVVNPDHLLPKTDYRLANPPRVVVPGRQYLKKDPSNLLRALSEINGVHCTLVGDGPYHERLKSLAAELGIASRCQFVASIANDELCVSLKDYDILVSANDCGGVSKVELEAAHVGLPVITNRHHIESEPEVLGENCLVVDDTPGSFKKALNELLSQKDLRERLGTALRASVTTLRSADMEAAYVSLYRDLIAARSRRPSAS